MSNPSISNKTAVHCPSPNVIPILRMKRYFSEEHEVRLKSSNNTSSNSASTIEENIKKLDEQIEQLESRYSLHSWNHFKFQQNCDFAEHKF